MERSKSKTGLKDNSQYIFICRGSHQRTNDTKIGKLCVQSSPTKPRKVDIAIPHLSRCLVQDLAQEENEQQWNNVQELQRRTQQSEQDKVRNVEVGCLGQVGRQQSGSNCWVLDDLGDDSRCGRGEGGDEEHLDHLEREVPGLDLHLRSLLSWLEELSEDVADNGHQGHEHREQAGRESVW